ncbi:MAG: phosphoglucosamine mutase [Elusimicrobia bacterium RBG_16_66_12]|nr:MAG: phosphoglucosamine mutase [Elusimicrobia bacterium RBG_16_66_12]
MSGRLFGTDGVRGIPGREPLTPATVRALAYHAARVFLERSGVKVNGRAPRIAVGRDTRGSGPALEKSLVLGFSAAGVETVDLGVIPTPGVSFLTPRLGCCAGVVISASHNPAEYNGIKFFDGHGFKMAPAMEHEVERRLLARRPIPEARGTLRSSGADRTSLYLDFLRSSLPAALDLDGVRLVVDCAHGAAAAFAPKLFKTLGAEVIPLGVRPNGRNINAGCGALSPETMAREVRRRRAHAGVAFDGDADRALFCDETGALLDGDAVIGAAAARLLRTGGLKGGKVALTVMSNFGLVRFLNERGVQVVTTPVGDRHVTAAIEREGLSLGGENSGHVVFRDFAPTGDGILTALQTLSAWRESGKPMSALRRLYSPTPQALLNLRVRHKPALDGLPRTQAAIARAAKALSGRGRVFVRYSGTEPSLRVLVEGPRKAENARIAGGIARTYLTETGQTEEAHS